MKYVFTFLYALLVTTICVTSPAQAYLDSGTVSLVLQSVTGAVAGLFLFGKSYLSRILNVFRLARKRTRGEQHDG